jgi:hypothetical protein
MLVELRSQSRDDTVETEGRPETRREGRRIGAQEIRLRVRRRSIEVREGERLVWTSPQALSFETGYLYLQMSSHSNYARSIYFTRVRID